MLGQGGSLQSIVVGVDGKPISNALFQVVHGQSVVLAAKPDANGRCRIDGLRSGVHLVRTAKSRQVCRFWTEKTAPPSARRGVVLTNSDSVIRGQNCCVPVGCESDCCSGCGAVCGESAYCAEGCCPGSGFASGPFAAANRRTAIGVGLFAVAAVAIGTSVSDRNSRLAAPASP